MIYLYTDGSVSRPTEGRSPGGWAFSFRHNGKLVQESGGCNMVTSNQMEMVAVIRGLQKLLELELTNEPICVVSDSQYVIHGASLWMEAWKKRGWLDRRGQKMKNKAFWKQIDYLAAHFNIRFKWIRGHAGNPDNEVCDKLARAAAFRAAAICSTAKLTEE